MQLPQCACALRGVQVLGDNLLSLIKLHDYRGIPIPTVKRITRQVLHHFCVELHGMVSTSQLQHIRSMPGMSCSCAHSSEAHACASFALFFQLPSSYSCMSANH